MPYPKLKTDRLEHETQNHKAAMLKQEEKFFDKGLRNKFWDMTPKIQGTNEKLNRWAVSSSKTSA